ncbi:hypothetical protein NFHSH190041_34680 [Shewanella sp. NFH-SH190041]|nr:hypothetical protein NFHSH190041_34680 [Shewanella sp. NFH-SH190041]
MKQGIDKAFCRTQRQLKNLFEHQGRFNGGIAELKASTATTMMLGTMPSVNRRLVQLKSDRATIDKCLIVLPLIGDIAFRLTYDTVRKPTLHDQIMEDQKGSADLGNNAPSTLSQLSIYFEEKLETDTIC